MSTGGEGFDLLAYRASQAEVKDDTYPIKVPIPSDNGDEPQVATIHMPSSRRWPIRAQALFAEADVIGAIKLIAGEENARLFEEADWTVGEFEALFEAMSKWSGFQTGRPSVPSPGRGSTPT